MYSWHLALAGAGAIKPDILVKGADYKDKEIVGSEFAKRVELIEFIEGKSTTKIIEKIKK